MLPIRCFVLLLLASVCETVESSEEKSNCSNVGLTLVQRRHQVNSKLPPEVAEATPIVAGTPIRLRTIDGRFLHCDGAKISVSDVASDFVVQKHGSEALHSGDSVNFACEGRRLSVLQDQVKVGSTAKMGETFILQKQQGDGPLQDKDAVYVLSTKDLQAFKVEGDQIKLRLAEDDTGEAFVLEQASVGHQNRWVILPDPEGFCDATLRCHRRLKVNCTAPNGTSVGFQHCNHLHRPWSYEPCFKSPLGACIDIAESDCIDLPGSWWNPDGKTCKEYKRRDCRRNELVHRACGETCGRSHCIPAKALLAGQHSAKGGDCEDDPVYRSAFNWQCSWFTQRNCSAYHFRDELMQACKKSCRLC
eukprot:Skav213774  [mRNA]  locus=scaffold3228:80342:81424:+ [translate_table: standard]